MSKISILFYVPNTLTNAKALETETRRSLLSLKCSTSVLSRVDGVHHMHLNILKYEIVLLIA